MVGYNNKTEFHVGYNNKTDAALGFILRIDGKKVDSTSMDGGDNRILKDTCTRVVEGAGR